MRDLLPSILHRALGKSLYELDIDSLEYSWKNGNVEFAAIIDYKNGVMTKQRKRDYQTAIVQRKLANKLEIPFFIVYTFLETNLKIKMMFVVPRNEFAKDLFNKINKSENGIWLSLRNYSRFLHYVRKIPNDEIAQKNLSNAYIEYPLPGEDCGYLPGDNYNHLAEESPPITFKKVIK